LLKKIFYLAVIYLVVSAFAAVELLITTWPAYPHSGLQWAILLIIAGPVSAVGEWVADKIQLLENGHLPIRAGGPGARSRCGIDWTAASRLCPRGPTIFPSWSRWLRRYHGKLTSFECFSTTQRDESISASLCYAQNRLVHFSARVMGRGDRKSVVNAMTASAYTLFVEGVVANAGRVIMVKVAAAARS
jgi:hypothetical protein